MRISDWSSDVCSSDLLQAGTSDGSQALTLDGTVQGESVVNLRPGGVDANGLAYDRTGDTITIGAGGAFSIGATDLANITTPKLVIGSDTHVGLIPVQAALARAGNLNLNTAGRSEENTSEFQSPMHSTYAV